MNNEKNQNRRWRAMMPLTGPAMAGLIIIAVVAFSLGGFLFGGDSGTEAMTAGHDHAAESEAGSEPTRWTCSMHPQIKLPRSGKCPICFMDLIPLDQGDGDELKPGQIRMSETARRLARIQTTAVVRTGAEREVRMAGRIGYDETSVAYITARAPGRLDQLFADFTGVTVRKGDRMASIYSPELLAAQEELVQAGRTVESLDNSSSRTLKSTANATLDAAREKLRLYGLTEVQIHDIRTSGKAADHLDLNAPVGGVVVGKDAQTGMYVKTGTRIYTIADLSRLWVLLEAYESDLSWLRIGQPVEFTVASIPGRKFRAQISFIDPMVNPKTRTVRVRAEVDNADHALKPDMFAGGTVKSQLDVDGEVIDSDRADINAPLLIPASAVLTTGKRAVVYIEIANDDEPTFEGRVVQLGPRVGDFYIVRSGVMEGEQIVTNGAFKIDSELQIQARPSMMSPPGSLAIQAGTPNRLADGNEARAALSPVYDAYFGIQMALANDNSEKAMAEFKTLREALSAVETSRFRGEAREHWTDLNGELSDAATKGADAPDIEAARDAFYYLSLAAIELHDTFGHTANEPYYLTFCPMARDHKGAYWLQTVDTVYNSFYGDAMLRCGEIKQTLPSGDGAAE